MKDLPKNFLISLTITILFWSFCWINIEVPATYNFDEFHYIPAALAFLHNKKMLNTEHPPLAKILIAQGISLLGNNPKGWRMMSCFFGGLTLMGLYFWALHLFKSIKNALLVVLLSVCNQVLFVQARIAMLDTFMAAFLVWASFCFSYWWDKRHKSTPLIMSAIFFGLALASKWFSLIPIGVAGILILFSFYLDHRFKFWQTVVFGGIVTLTYMLTFIPYDFPEKFSFSRFIVWQKIMWERQGLVGGTHPYSSSWWSWPLELRPIWYDYALKNKSFRGILFLANPILLWGGALSILYCAWDSFKKKNKTSKQILLAYSVCFLSWSFIPRKVTFFYYYYPAILILSLSIVQALAKRPKLRFVFVMSTITCFLYFLPILNSSPRSVYDFSSWVWFNSWI